MQSPATTFFRASVILACLVAIPSLAVVGGKLPKPIQRWVGTRASAGEAGIATPSKSPPVEMEGGVPPCHDSRGFVRSPQYPGETTMASWPGQATNRVAEQGEQGVPARQEADPLLELQQRLRQLGSTYYRLESWGNRRELYRFQCRVGIGGDPTFTRCFEATDDDPHKAMRHVLGQVERWRASRGGAAADPEHQCRRAGLPTVPRDSTRR